MSIPPLEISLSIFPNLLEIEQGGKSNVEVKINSTPGYAPEVNLYPSKKLDDIKTKFEHEKILMPIDGFATTTLNINTTENANLGPTSLFIFANSTFPPDNFLTVADSNKNVSAENIRTQTGLLLEVKQKPGTLDQVSDW